MLLRWCTCGDGLGVEWYAQARDGGASVARAKSTIRSAENENGNASVAVNKAFANGSGSDGWM